MLITALVRRRGHPDALLGPQLVIVDAMIEGIGQRGVIANFQKRLRELQVFLGFVLGIKLEISKFEEGWVPEVDAEGRALRTASLDILGTLSCRRRRAFRSPVPHNR